MVLTVRAIIEIAGFPEEHIKNVTQEVLKHIKQNQNLQCIKENIGEVKKLKEKLFSSFIEIEVKVPGFNALNQFCFDYMPSSIEIIDAEKITVSTREIEDATNDLLAKLHEYHAMITNLNAQVQITKPKKSAQESQEKKE